MIPDLSRPLQRYCSSAFLDKAELIVKDITKAKSGIGSDIYFFRIEHGLPRARVSEELVLRIYTRDDAYDKSEHEFTSMRKLREAGYPVPRVHVVERDNSPFQRPFMIMERVIGQEMWQLLHSTRERQNEALTQLSRLLVQLHSIDSRPFVNERSQHGPADHGVFVDRWLETVRSLLVRFPIAGLEPVLEWLVSRREEVPCLRPSLVHSDFHPGNVLVKNDGSAIVVDWAGLNVSDARFDLGHTLLLLSCVTEAAWPKTVLERYEELAGAAVEQLAYFEVAACFRWFVALTVSVRYGADKLGLGPNVVTRPATPVLAKAHGLLLARTGVGVPEIEALIR